MGPRRPTNQHPNPLIPAGPAHPGKDIAVAQAIKALDKGTYKALLGAVQALDNLVGWPFTEPANRAFRTANGVGRKQLAKIAFRLLTRYNDVADASVLGDGPPVSLTTFGRRIPTAFAAIESIGLGSVRPSRLVLWLDSADDLAQLDVRLARLVKRGLEVRLSENYGPHTKYYPFVRDLWTAGSPMVTADDDIIYPPNWLRLLAAGHRTTPAEVIGHRAREIAVERGAIGPYDRWTGVRTIAAGPRVFATGVSGVIYPPQMCQELKDRGEEFLELCPKADDIWLHYVAVSNNVGVRQVRQRGRHYAVVVPAQVEKLQNDNVAANGNDRQVLATYSPAAIQRVVAGA